MVLAVQGLRHLASEIVASVVEADPASSSCPHVAVAYAEGRHQGPPSDYPYHSPSAAWASSAVVIHPTTKTTTSELPYLCLSVDNLFYLCPVPHLWLLHGIRGVGGRLHHGMTHIHRSRASMHGRRLLW